MTGLHCLAWRKAASAQNVLNDIPAINDGIISVGNSHFQFGVDVRVLAVVALGADLQRARISNRTLFGINPAYIRPVNAATLLTDPDSVADYFRAPVHLRAGEDTIIEALQSNAVAQDINVLAVVAASLSPAPKGEAINMRFTSTTAATANTWTDLTTTLETSPPRGVYAVIGAELESANGQAFQLKFDGQEWRPGGFMTNAIGKRPFRRQVNGDWGQWGTFIATAPPRVRALCNGADASFEGYFKCVQIG